ncbi:MAG: hypothetical protein KI791_05680 [Cyclobacteriaceae bacterium]|nr:hypothetical protein [Cyclobacteriaceae bacterium SS2]
MQTSIKNTLLVWLLGAQLTSYAQYTFFTPEGSFAIEASLENTDMVRLPIYRNEITSLSVIGDYIVGGTSAIEGKSPFVFTASLESRKMTEIKDLEGIVEGQQRIRSGFVKSDKGQLFAGTMPQSSSTSGHLISVSLDKKKNLVVKDFGTPVIGEGIYALTSDPTNRVLYGLTYPSGYFFSFDISTKKSEVYKDLAPSGKVRFSLEDHFSVTAEDYLSRALIADDNGLVYGSLPYGVLFYFDPKTKSLVKTEEELPEVWGRRSLGQIHCWVKTSKGEIYGANRADGQLFKLNAATQKIKNLGKPIMMTGLAGLAEGGDGKIYGIAGGYPGYGHLFSYDDEDGFVDYGNPQFDMVEPGIEQGIAWRGYQMETIAASEDGKYIIIGEAEALSQLMVFPVK